LKYEEAQILDLTYYLTIKVCRWSTRSDIHFQISR